MGLFELLLGSGIALVIVNLVVRDRTEFRVSRLRAELMTLRTSEKRQTERRKDVDRLAASLEECVGRAEHRSRTARLETETLVTGLKQLYKAVHREELPEELLSEGSEEDVQ